MRQLIIDGPVQQPLGSGFNRFSTADDVMQGVSLNGKTVVITGGYAGIGLEMTRALSAAGATVVVPARDLDKARKALDGTPNVELLFMDLMDPASIDAFSTDVVRSGRAVHLLFNNAGVMWVPLRRDARGYESQLVTNHLGHFQLTAGLWEALKRAGSARVINTSSYGHHIAPFDFEDPNFERRSYESLQGYGQSKTANNLFTVALDRRGKAYGVRAYAVHPGSVNGTDLGREAPMALFQQMGTHDADGNIRPSVAETLKTVPQGAATNLWCATSNLLQDLGGVYCEDGDIAQLDTGNITHDYQDPATLRGVMPYSLDANDAEKLWALSEALTRIPFHAH